MEDKKAENNVEKVDASEVLPVEDLDIKQDASILIAGQRRCGKSVLAVNILKVMTEKYDYRAIILISDTAHIEANGSFNFIDKKAMFKGNQMDEVIPRILQYQEKNCQKKSKRSQNIIVVFDDLNLNKKSQFLDILFSQGRHFKISVLLLVQYPKLVVTNIIRSNTDIIFMAKQNNMGIDAMYGTINVKINRREFTAFLQKNAVDNQFVMYNIFDDDPRLRVVKAQFFKAGIEI